MTAKEPGSPVRPAQLEGDELWAFSLRFYARPTVSEHCLALQDAAGADVNLILLLVHAAASGRVVTAEQVAWLDHACSQWRDTVIRPLREARRAVRSSQVDDTRDLYADLKATELAAERIAQGLLARAFASLNVAMDRRSPATLATANLEAYRSLTPMPDAPINGLNEAFAQFMNEQAGRDS